MPEAVVSSSSSALTISRSPRGLSFMPGPPLSRVGSHGLALQRGQCHPRGFYVDGGERAERAVLEPRTFGWAGARPCGVPLPRARARRFPGLERARGRIAAGVVDPDQRSAAEVRDEEGVIRRAERAVSRSPTTSAAATGGAASTAASTPSGRSGRRRSVVSPCPHRTAWKDYGGKHGR